MKHTYHVIALGGSLIVPHLSDTGGIDVLYLKKFRAFILSEVKKGKRFVIVTGGGRTARVYQKVASGFTGVTKDDLDWLGIATLTVNATLVCLLFKGISHPEIMLKEPSASDISRLKQSKFSIFVSSGWEPGRSSDDDAIRLAKKFDAKDLVDAGDIAYVYDQDPKLAKNAKALPLLSWKEYKKLIPSVWTPGMSAPFDPIASKAAEKYGISVKILNGKDIGNMKKAIQGKPFKGTIIS